MTTGKCVHGNYADKHYSLLSNTGTVHYTGSCRRVLNSTHLTWPTDCVPNAVKSQPWRCMLLKGGCKTRQYWNLTKSGKHRVTISNIVGGRVVKCKIHKAVTYSVYWSARKELTTRKTSGLWILHLIHVVANLSEVLFNFVFIMYSFILLFVCKFSI